MHTTPTDDQQVSVIPIALLTCSLIGLFFLLVSWIAGGQSFFESLYGYYTLITLTAGVVAGLVGRKFVERGAAGARVSPA